MFKVQTDKILQSEMDRKAFLKNTGIAFAGLIGVTAIIKNINGFAANSGTVNSANTSYGYGASAYGGDLPRR